MHFHDVIEWLIALDDVIFHTKHVHEFTVPAVLGHRTIIPQCGQLDADRYLGFLQIIQVLFVVVFCFRSQNLDSKLLLFVHLLWYHRPNWSQRQSTAFRAWTTGGSAPPLHRAVSDKWCFAGGPAAHNRTSEAVDLMMAPALCRCDISQHSTLVCTYSRDFRCRGNRSPRTMSIPPLSSQFRRIGQVSHWCWSPGNVERWKYDCCCCFYIEILWGQM